MRIAVNARFLIKDKLEGVGWYTYEILSRMVHAHPEDDFILIHDRPLAPEFKFGKNVKTVKTWLPSRHPILWHFWFEHAIPRILNREKPDLFLSFDGHLSIKTTIPTVYVLHDLAYLHYQDEIRTAPLRFYKKYIPKYIDRADRIISVSQHGKNDLLTHFPHISANHISIVGNACRSIFKPLSNSNKIEVRNTYAEGKPYLFYVGAVQPRKNISRMIQAMDVVVEKHPGAKLLIAGRQAWKTEEIMQKWSKSKSKENIKFLGYVPDAEMARILAAAEALVYPSLFEGFGVPVLEAMHCEVPIVTSKGSSMEEVAGGAALLVDPLNTEYLGSAMARIFNNTDLANALIAEGKKQRAQYNWDKSAKDMYTVLLHLYQHA